VSIEVQHFRLSPEYMLLGFLYHPSGHGNDLHKRLTEEFSYICVQVNFSFTGSQDLRMQLEQGGSTDLFASADHKNMDLLISEGLVVLSSQQDFTTNRLVLILPPENPGNLETLHDLSMLHIQLIMAVSILTGTPPAHIHCCGHFGGRHSWMCW
jgi:hypothetical protein